MGWSMYLTYGTDEAKTRDLAFAFEQSLYRTPGLYGC
jgi:hypothetical protein